MKRQKGIYKEHDRRKQGERHNAEGQRESGCSKPQTQEEGKTGKTESAQKHAILDLKRIGATLPELAVLLILDGRRRREETEVQTGIHLRLLKRLKERLVLLGVNGRKKQVFDVEIETRVIDGVVERYPLFLDVGGRARGEKQLQRNAIDKGEGYGSVEEHGLVGQRQLHLLRYVDEEGER